MLVNRFKEIAAADEKIRAVLMNGSRVNTKIKPDKYQDYDIVFIVTDINHYTKDHNWIKKFGEIVLLQLPDEMTIGEVDPDGIGYLMLFADGNRIDLTLFPVEKVMKNQWPDSLTICLLDKDKLFDNLPKADDSDYFVKKPSEKQFHDVCNEFWWCSINIAKALLREEITHAKEIVEVIVRPMLMKMIEWKVGGENNFEVSFGKGGKFMSNYVSEEFYQRVLGTYADAEIENNWTTLHVMTALFEDTLRQVAHKLGFNVNEIEIRNAKNILEDLTPFK